MVTMARRLIVFYLCLALDGTFSHAETTNPVDKLADKLLNTDQRYGLANLISAVYANIKSAPHESASGRFGILSAFFRILGLDGKKIGAIAVNVLILIAESISASLSTKSSAELPQSRKQTVTGSPFQWMNENAVVAEMASHMTDASLPNEVVKHIKERSLDEATGCIQLLMCKVSPFVWGMQRALNASEAKKKTRLFDYLPSIEEVGQNGDSCDGTYSYCSPDFL